MPYLANDDNITQNLINNNNKWIIYTVKIYIDSQVFKDVLIEGFDASEFTTTQIFYSSKDGTKIPMFIVSKKVIIVFIFLLGDTIHNLSI